MQAAAAGLISKQQAEQDALHAVGAGTVDGAYIEKEMGRLVWAVDILHSATYYQVWVDAHTGTTLRIILHLPPYKPITKQQAEPIALKAIGGGKVVQAQQDQWKGYPIWDVTITQPGWEYEVYVDARTGKVLKIIKRKNGALAGLISKKQAEQIALNAVGGGSVQNAQLDDYNGKRAWDVDITQPGWEFTVYVDAHSGAVLKIEKQRS
jgi:uncharacterized membrane protein YkoI